MSSPLKEEPFTIFAITTLVAGVFAAGLWAGRASGVAAPHCDCWEHKPMPFCEVLGLPVRGKIAVMPDVVVSTDP